MLASLRFSSHRNVLLLALCQTLFMSSQTTVAFSGGLVGNMLADDKSLATLPLTCMILGVAVSTLPVSLYMRRVGRQHGFMTGAVLGLIGTAIASLAIWLGSFWLFCAGMAALGVYNATCQYYRFAAADAAEPAFRARAISYVVAGGVAAAIIGPELGKWTEQMIPPFTFLGCFIALFLLCLAAMGLQTYLRLPQQTAAAQGPSGRPLLQIARQPVFIVAALSGALAFGVMNLVMTATPLAMLACGFASRDSGTVIQWHALGMFAPSFFTGHLMQRFGTLNVMAVGALMLFGCAGFTLSGIDLMNFLIGNLLLGVGWNFLFIGATALVTEIHTVEERAKVQGLNEFLVFGTTATTSFLSGKTLFAGGWSIVNIVTLPMTALALAAVIWLMLNRRSLSARAA
jgi:MFS family permease